jgi:hypothetical protein
METENNQPAPEQPPVQQNQAEKVIQPLSSSPFNPSPSVVVSSSQQTAKSPNIQPAGQATGQYQPSSSDFSQADALAQENKGKHKRRLLIGGGVLVGLIILVIAGFIAHSLLFGFKTITYDDGKGYKFQQTFYSRYTVKAAPGGSGTQELASKVSVGGLYPLALTIFKGTQNQPASSILDCSGAGLSSALQITNKSTNSTVNICSENQGLNANQPSLYIGVLQSSNTYYTIVINQDVNFQKLLTSQQNAKAGLQKIGLSAYNNDITTIVSSIKPLQ